MDALTQSSRFLMQATLGVDEAVIAHVAQVGVEPWLAEQLNQPAPHPSHYAEQTEQIWHHFRDRLLHRHGMAAINGSGNNPALPYKWYFRMAWWHSALTEKKHLLRQRIAQALSEILVISDQSNLELDAVGMGSYYDLLYTHAFGRYSDLLYDVAMHPCMGVYLSHMNNQKADPLKPIHPDENFAREIMQLFTIGLYALNADGSRKLDPQGQPIPSYDNRDIKSLARVFTGLHADSYEYAWQTDFWQAEYNGYPVAFEDGIDKTYKTVPFVNMQKPMVVEEAFHDRGAKQLLKGRIRLRGHQDGAAEIRSAITQLVAHPNTAPFIARQLINQLVTANPSPDYVRTVAAKFGPHGDMKAVIKAILSYPLHHPVSGVTLPSGYQEGGKVVQSQKLKSPTLRLTQILRAFGVHNRANRLWVIGDELLDQLQHHPLSSPTVFNFYKPDFVPHGPLAMKNMVAPAFELHTSATSIAYVNLMYYWFFGGFYPAVSLDISADPNLNNVPELDTDTLWQQPHARLNLNLKPYQQLAANPASHDGLIDRLSLLLTGKQQLPIKGQIKEAFSSYQDRPDWVVQTILFMLTISPEFTVQEA
ncbi:DUF1800 family protein [Magnetococcus sp. PR-3]|uniref:DUF1800 family protein n=1 Tax=Magnetococcus sp. PR-3 TaxID=3120355 RepID=UPI002FCE3A8A